MRPTDDQLLRYKRGTLPAGEVATVEAWMDATADAADRLAKLDAPDSLAVALADAPKKVDSSTFFGATADATRPAADPDAPIPPLPAGYRLVKELGRGGMGVVLHATDTTLGRPVAVKMMLPAFAARADAKERFLREARSLAAVESEHIVPIYHVGETPDGTPYLVMPLLAGETLDARLARGPLSEPELTAVARHAAEGLKSAHAKGVIHRDIKPSNIWLEADAEGRFRRARLLDFGLARPTHTENAMTATGQLLGTPAYMSTEQANGDPLTPATDLFSLGATLFHAAAGRRPFAGDTPMSIIKSLALDTPAPVRRFAPALSEPVARLIDDLLAKDPPRRPTALEVVNRLDAPTAPTRRKPTRGPLVALAAAVLAFVLLAGVIVIIVRDKDGKKVAEVTVPDSGTVTTKDGDGPEIPLAPTKPLPPTKPGDPKPDPMPVVPMPPKPPEPGNPLSAKALTQTPKVFDGIQSWSVATTRPTGTVIAAAYSRDGKKLAVGGGDGIVRILDAKTFEPTELFIGMGEDANHLAWFPKGDRLLARSGHQVVVWEYPSGKKLVEFSVAHSHISLAPDGKKLLLDSDLYDPDTGKRTGPLNIKGTGPAVWHPDGKLLAIAPRGTLEAQIVNVTANEVVDTFRGKSDADRPGVSGWSPDGKQLLIQWSFTGVILYEGDEKKPLKNALSARYHPVFTHDSKRLILNNSGGQSFDLNKPDVAPVEFLSNKDTVEQQLDWHAVSTSASGTAIACRTDLRVFNTDFKPVHTSKMFDGFKTVPSGHYKVKDADADQVVYVVQTKDGQQTLTPAEFEKKTGWKNDPSKVGPPK